MLVANAPHAAGLAYLMPEGWNFDCNQGDRENEVLGVNK